MAWIARLKAAGEPCPCGRKRRDHAAPTRIERVERERAKADARRLEAPFRRIHKEAEALRQTRAAEKLARPERVRVALENLRQLSPERLPGESSEEHAMRFACVERRRRHDPERFRRELEEMRTLVESGF
jgi:hypothetical protein